MKIPISEIFGNTFQGEGRMTGKPSIFVRFWGCNKICNFCDSEYSWKPEVEKATMMSLEEVIEKIKSFKCKHIIFTGGEPCLFQKHIIDIQEKLGYSFTYELETNGSIELDPRVVLNQTNISPKLLNSGNKKYEMNIFKSIRWTGVKDLKFVVANLQDLKEVEEFIIEYKQEILSQGIGIYLMPLGRDFESQMNKIVMNHCMKKGYNFCMRSHLIWFGDKKGV